MRTFDRISGCSAIDLGQTPEFQLGGLRITPAQLSVSADGVQRELQPRVMQVLVALAQARPGVVSRDRLSELCWGGRVVGDDALNRCILALRHLADDLPGNHFSIETVPRVGHRLLEAGASSVEFIPGGWRRWRMPVLAGSLLVALAAAAFVGQDRRAAPAVAGQAEATTSGTDGHVHNLYVTASGLIRTRSRSAGPTAVDLLSDAVRADPEFAPAWAKLAEATLLAGALNDGENFIAAATTAQRYARHALRLDPDLPEAHRALGGLHGFGTPEARAHLLRAAQLDPADPENLVGLGVVHAAAGDFEGELAAYRRACEADPDYFRAVAAFAVATAEMGDRGRAEAIARRALRAKDIQRELLLGKIAWAAGDYSDALRRWSIVERSDSRRWSESARRFRDEGEQFLGLGVGALVTIPRPFDQRHLGRIVITGAPTPETWKLRNRDAMAAAVYRDENHVAAKVMLNRGRWRELVAAYDGPGGLIGIRRSFPLRNDQIAEVPVAIIALRQAGRSKEADLLLHNAYALLSASYRRGQVPMWVEVERAALLTLQGRKQAAVESLNRAMQRGWRSGGATDLPAIGDEPVFRTLRGTPGFERLRARLAAEIEREKREAKSVA